jgi:short-subunit dehydrogenase
MCRAKNATARKKGHVVNQLRKSVVITGASKGLGEALALLYAGQGRTLGLIGRNRPRLEAVAARCRDRRADVVIGALDVKDGVALARWIKAFDARHPLDLLIVNAGMFTGHGKSLPESVEEMTELVRTNLEGAALTIAAAVPMMRARQRGHIAIVGSLAALHPLADAPAYSASKAGVMAYGEALREWLAPDHIAVSLIYPGHIKTAQVEHHVGALPLIVSPQTAARIIKRGLDRGRTSIIFPKTLLWLIRAGRCLPWRLRAMLGTGTRFYVAKPENSAVSGAPLRLEGSDDKHGAVRQALEPNRSPH